VQSLPTVLQVISSHLAKVKTEQNSATAVSELLQAQSNRKWRFHQENGAFRCSDKANVNSEIALDRTHFVKFKPKRKTI